MDKVESDKCIPNLEIKANMPATKNIPTKRPIRLFSIPNLNIIGYIID